MAAIAGAIGHDATASTFHILASPTGTQSWQVYPKRTGRLIDREGFLVHWSEARQQVEGYLSSLTSMELGRRPISGISSIGRQLRHVLDVAQVYYEALDSGQVDLQNKVRDRDLEENCDKLRKAMQQQREQITGSLLTVHCADSIDYPGQGPIQPDELLRYWLEHEWLHIGIIYTLAKASGVDVPSPF